MLGAIQQSNNLYWALCNKIFSKLTRFYNFRDNEKFSIKDLSGFTLLGAGLTCHKAFYGGPWASQGVLFAGLKFKVVPVQ